MFYDTVNDSNNRRAIHVDIVRACDALKAVATSDIILNISDGHNQGQLSINEDTDKACMDAIRSLAEKRYLTALAEVPNG